jgi:tetratricopeptide (TPR) repeat protein
MSDERYETACGRVKDAYAEMRDLPLHKERYMDRTARLRAMRPAILEMQKGDAKMVKKKFDEAKSHYAAALAGAPGDYAGLLSMAKCLLALGKADEARAYVEKAKGVMPAEPQAVHVSGMLALNTRRFDEALASFSAYEQMLPGNANSAFYKGYTLESMGWRAAAAKEYQRYRRAAPQGEFAGLTAQRLTSWGYLQPAGGSSGPR